jgi:hypothetical protein
LATIVEPALKLVIGSINDGRCLGMQAAGLEIPERCLMNVSLAIVACLSGWVNMGYRSPPLDQLDVVEDAASNADRYYRFVVPADEKNTAAEMAAAFKSTCRQWYVDRRVSNGS